ncbi:MAG: IclR family transcriptional regulator [Lachnospiraceae bacterium]|nr:IclR family transcriptional regulator [Lachnospiraceae bacterium]
MSEKGVQVIERTFDIIELLAVEPQGLGVSDVARRLSLNKSTAHRILNAITDRGYLEKTADGIYSLGMQFVELTSRKLGSIELTTEAKPFLNELTAKLGQSSHLAILDGSDAVYIDKVEVTKNLRLYSQIGKRIPVYCSGLGKSLLFDTDNQTILSLLRNCSMERLTETTLLTPEAVLEEIEIGRKQGWTVDNEEHDEGIRCIAAPVYDYRGKVIAAISSAGPSSFFMAEKDKEYSKIVCQIAQNISERMGYLGYQTEKS